MSAGSPRTPLAVTYDDEADAAYVWFCDIADDDVRATTTVELAHGGPVLLETDRDGRLLGVEVLGASRSLPPELVHQLTQPHD